MSQPTTEPPPEPAPRGDGRAEQRRRTEARILAAAAGLCVASGYERTTIRAVAQAAGVDAGLVMHYFGSKQELFDQVTNGLSPLPPLGGPPDQVADQILAHLGGSRRAAAPAQTPARLPGPLEPEPVQSLAVLRSMLTPPEAAQSLGERTIRYR